MAVEKCFCGERARYHLPGYQLVVCERHIGMMLNQGLAVPKNKTVTVRFLW